MRRPHLKVCCIASREEAALAVRLGASALGLVAEMPSGPGVIADDVIAAIATTVPPPVARFLLTSRREPDAIVAHVAASRVDTVQLVCDDLPTTVYATLRASLPHVRIVQVLHVEDERVLQRASDVAAHVDAILLDSGRPSAAVPELGGTGRVHDWQLSRRVVERAACPVFLAGGLSPNNVRRAIDEVGPYGLDICSGVRTDGKLDERKLAALIAAMG